VRDVTLPRPGPATQIAPQELIAPPLNFEGLDPHVKASEPEAGIETIDCLIDAGYSAFLYFDNFGNLLPHADAKQRGLFADPHQYLASNRHYGAAVYYFDVCAYQHEDGKWPAAT
jgi:hypothetical protein